jgi:hypothetical protein
VDPFVLCILDKVILAEPAIPIPDILVLESKHKRPNSFVMKDLRPMLLLIPDDTEIKDTFIQDFSFPSSNRGTDEI